ncbi:MAG TPA: hypothetical protein VGJ87_23070, partial [Roseiflexaceae bacterium]
MKRYDWLPNELLSARDLIISSLWRSPEHREFLRFDDEGRYEHGSLIDRSALARRHAACHLDRARSACASWSADGRNLQRRSPRAK